MPAGDCETGAAAGWLAGAGAAVVGGEVEAIVVVVGAAVVGGAAVVEGLESAPAETGPRRKEAAAAQGSRAQSQRIRLRCIAGPMCGVSSSAGRSRAHPGRVGL